MPHRSWGSPGVRPVGPRASQCPPSPCSMQAYPDTAKACNLYPLLYRLPVNPLEPVINPNSCAGSCCAAQGRARHSSWCRALCWESRAAWGNSQGTFPHQLQESCSLRAAHSFSAWLLSLLPSSSAAMKALSRPPEGSGRFPLEQ